MNSKHNTLILFMIGIFVLGLVAISSAQDIIITNDPPTITLLGDETVSLELGTSYIEYGATAQDAEEGDLTDSIEIDGEVDVTTPGTYMVTYTVSDTAGDTVEATRTVKVVITANSYALLATNSIWLKANSHVGSGFVGVLGLGEGPFLDSGVELSVGREVSTAPAVRLSAPNIRVKRWATIEGTLFYENLHEGRNAQIAEKVEVGSDFWPLVDLDLIEFHTGTPGDEDIVVRRNHVYELGPGAYDKVIVRSNGTLIFTGGVYHLSSFNARSRSEVYFQEETILLVEDTFATGRNVYFGPAGLGPDDVIDPGSDAPDIMIFVNGIDGNESPEEGRSERRSKKAARIGPRNTFYAYIYVRNGTLWIGKNTQAIGSFIGRDVLVGKYTMVDLLKYSDWAKSQGGQPLPLSQVKYWAYQIQKISHDIIPGLSAVDALAKSHYDMLVIEPTRTDWSCNGSCSSSDAHFNTAAMVKKLKASRASDGIHRKLVIAYIDIGQAEDWRWYWNWSPRGESKWSDPPPSSWPKFILAPDPDGFDHNYVVAFWDKNWKDIVINGTTVSNPNNFPNFNYNSVLDEVIKDGFDGVYLDWVEGYNDKDVIDAAKIDGKNPANEMLTFIDEMRNYAKKKNVPDFIIIQQNAPDLGLAAPTLFSKIDAISQEAIWYDGDPVDDWNNSNGYDKQTSLSLQNYYLQRLAPYKQKGLPVFNCEYADANSADAYSKSLAQGFIPYCTRRPLSQLTDKPPPGYCKAPAAWPSCP